jgi:GNAT superfamily N-acetyltransferase
MNTRVVTDLDEATELRAVYQTHWWFEGRELERIRRSIRHSDEVFGIRECEDGNLVATCRVITDYVYTGKILDVIVAASHRREGLGTELLSAVTESERLAAVTELTVNCREGLVPFYEECGFQVHEMISRDRSGPEEDYYVMVYQ